MERQTTAPLLNSNMWSTLQDSMVNGFSALNDSETNISSGRTFELPSSCKPSDSIVPLLFFNDSQIVDTVFFKPVEQIIFAVLYPILFVFGFVGNVAFLTVVALVKEMRTLTNFYLVNLAVADILFTSLVLIFVTVSFVFSNGVRMADNGRTDVQCGILYGAAYTTFFSPLCLVTLVTFDRFLAICYPIRHRIINTKKRSITLVVIAWISGTAMAIFITPAWGSVSRFCLIWPPRSRWEQLSNVRYSCSAVDKNFVQISTAVLPLSFVVTLTFNIFLYRNIIIRLNNRAVSKKEADKTRNTVARMLITNGIIFFFCLGPKQLLNLLDFVESTTRYRVLDNNQYQALLQFSRCLVLLNSVINPYVYGISNSNYRKAFMMVFTCGIKGRRSKNASIPSVSVLHPTDEMKIKDCNCRI